MPNWGNVGSIFFVILTTLTYDKMKQLLALLLSSTVLVGLSQNQWLNRGGGNGNDEALDVDSDLAGNYYITGYKTADAYFGGDLLESNGLSDIFLTKLDPNGNFLWSVDAGGTLADRGYSVYTDDNGFTLVTGYYSGEADFSGTIITSNAMSQDLFLAKYDPSGNLLWVRSEGGPGAETGYDVELDNAGNIVVTGQFRGTITIGASTYTSEINPGTGARDFDIMIIKYDPAGNLLWSKHGKAPFDDRGLDIAIDNMDNIYVCGQFSDSIEFDNVYNNNAMNAGFVMKMDANGVEDWFRTFAAGQSIIYSIEHDGSNNVLFTGNYQGNLVMIGGGPPVVYPATYTNTAFVFKLDAGGSPVWHSTLGSDNWLTSRDLAIDSNDDIYITGNFRCQFSELSDSLGAGMFNSVGFRDVYMAKFSAAGAPIWQRQLGGQQEDYCSGITVVSPDHPMIAGGYGSQFWMARNVGAFSFDPATHLVHSPVSACPETAEDYVGMNTVGNLDVFFTDGFQDITGHFNFWKDPACSYEQISVEINNGNDTIAGCPHLQLLANPYRHWEFGPQLNYSWSPEPASDSLNSISTSGYHYVTVTTNDGCFESTDSIYADVHPIPDLPTMVDDHGFQINPAAPYENIAICVPDTVQVTFGSIAAGDSMVFSGPSHDSVSPVDYLLYNGGGYSVTVYNDYGCVKSDNFTLKEDTIEVNDSIVPYVVHPDTITVCSGDNYGFQIFDSLGTIGCLELHSVIPLLGPSADNCGYVDFNASTTGMIYMEMVLVTGWENTCGLDTTHIPFQDSIYVIVNPNPPVSSSISGPATFCPGDTVTLVSSGIGNLTWSGSILQNFGDSVWVNIQGSFTLTATAIDTATGCSSLTSDHHVLTHHQHPDLTTNPDPPIICPGDSVQLTCDPGIDYYWVGPDGNFGGSNQTVYGHTPGWYHCVLTLPDGCVITSESVELYEYNTPFLIAYPGVDLCHFGTIDIEVWTNGPATLNWLSPLSGSSPTQTVDSAGVYTCEITQCGVTTTAFITVIDGSDNTYITASPDSIVCSGDSVVLIASSGMLSYDWSPTGETTDSIIVTAPGIYEVTTVNTDWCTTTKQIEVYNYDIPAAVINDTLVCEGDTVVLNSTGVDTLNWLDGSGSLVSTSVSHELGEVINDTLIYYSYTDSNGCHSPVYSVDVSTTFLTGVPSIYGDTTYCEGDLMVLSTDSLSGVGHTWLLGGVVLDSGLAYVDSSVLITEAGTYQLVLNIGTCYSDTGNIKVDVQENPALNPVVATGPHCPGEYAEFTYSSADQLFLSDPSGMLIPGSSPIILNPVTQADSGTYSYYYQNIYGCVSEVDSIDLTVYPAPPTANIYGVFDYCVGDTALLYAAELPGITYDWSGPTGFTAATDSIFIPGLSLANQGYYQLIVSNTYGCSDTARAPIKVWELHPLDLGNDTIVCEGANPVLDAGPYYHDYFWSTGSTAPTIVAAAADTFWVEVSIGPGCTASDTIIIYTEDCTPSIANVFSPNGDGHNDYFKPVGNGLISLNVQIFDRWGSKMAEFVQGDPEWDGTNMFTSLDCPEGVYYYVAKVENEIGEVFEEAGFVQLYR